MNEKIQINNAENKNIAVSKMIILRSCLHDIYRDARNLENTQKGNEYSEERKSGYNSTINSLLSDNKKTKYESYYSDAKSNIEHNKKKHSVDWDPSFALYAGIACAIIGLIVFTALILSGVIEVPIKIGDGEFYINFLYPNCEDVFDYVIVFVLGLLTGAAMGIGFGLACGVIAIICLYFVALMRYRHNEDAQNREISKKLSKVKSEEENFFKKSGEYDQIVLKNNIKIEELKNKIEIEDKLIAANNTRIKDLQNKIAKKWKSCVRVFSNVLHNSDFENIDYLLYLLITGRADTTKEALQLLDEAKRTEAIIGAIEISAQYLASNFKDALIDLKGSIVEELKSINNSINAMHSTLNGIRNDIGQMQNQLHDDLVNIKNSVDMNTITTMSFAISTREMLSEIRNNTNKIQSWQYVNGELVAR